MALDNKELQAYFTWRNGLEESDYPTIYENLRLLDTIQQLIIEGSEDSHEQIRRAVFELD